MCEPLTLDLVEVPSSEQSLARSEVLSQAQESTSL